MTSATDNRTTELLPCPFCGGEAELRGPYFGHWHVGCANTDCICSATFETIHETKANAIAAWNTRAERTCKCVAEHVCSPFDGKTIVLHRCSVCHGFMRPFMKYCPGCGAKVVGE